MGTERELIERLIFSGTIEQYGQVKERLYDPMNFSHDGLDDYCFYCGIFSRDDQVAHATDCPWVEAMQLLGHDLPEGHAIGSFVESERV